MPYPRSRSYATPEETFGITQKPLNAWFDAAASGMTRSGPAFSASFEDATLRNQQRELESERLRREMESEQAASAFLQRAAGEKPDALMQMIAEDPAILGSKDAPMIRDYIATRQQVQQQRQAQQPLSNKTLGPAIAKSITDPIQRMKFQQRLEAGEEATVAYEGIQNEAKMQLQQAARQKAVYDALGAGEIDETDVMAILNSENPDLTLAAARGKVKRAGKIGGGDTPMEKAKAIMGIIKDAEDIGDAPTADRFRKMLGEIDFGDAKPQPTGDGKEKATPEGEVTQAPPVLPPAPPASDVEAARLKSQQQRDVQESQKQQLADAAWTGVKGTAAARGTQDDPTAIMSEAKAAIVGGTAKNPRAQRIAALARAFADGRQVETTQEFTENFEEGGRPVNMPVRKSPEEVLVAELGYEPDAIVGQAPTKAGGAMRNITALEAARAILAEAADPFVKLKGVAASTPTITRDTARSLIQEVDAAK